MTSRVTATKSALLLLILVAAAICVSRTPALAATGKKAGTSTICAATLEQTVVAITNAFSSCRYHGMGFTSSPDHFDIAKGRWTSKPATNEWILDTYNLPVSSIAWGKTMVPYYAQLLVAAEQLLTDQCRVTVTTISASIPHGREIGIHGGWAVHMKHIPPVLEEETNVLSRIERQLRSIQAGHSEPLPATPDTTEALKHPIKVDLDLHPEAKESLPRSIQVETNAALKAELLKMLITATNAAPQ
jgi:hypothetical protein